MCALSCQQGLDACNGICVNLQSDIANCGKCKVACPMGNVCTNGTCQANCGMPLIACNSMCVDPRFDPGNCGKCNNVCPGLANASAICLNSGCSIGPCNQGFLNCDGNNANGCEVNLNTDAANCGKCGTACMNGATCVNGVCSGGICGNGKVDPGEEYDPPPGPFQSVSVDKTTCLWHFENVVQFYCNGSCDWTGKGQSCTQGDADIFCKLRTGNPNSTAKSYQLTTALAQPGFPCAPLGYGTSIGTLPLRGVNVTVRYQDSSILANHGPGTVIINPVCN